MDKVGVFYTAGFFIIIVVFFSFLVIVNNDFIATTDRISDNFGYEKIRNLDQSIQRGFSDLYFLTSGIIITKGSNYTSFREALPNTLIPNLVNNVSRYKDFLKSNFSIVLNDTIINSELPLVIRPHNITIRMAANNSYGMTATWTESFIPYIPANFTNFLVVLVTNFSLNSTSCIKDTGGFIGSSTNVQAYGPNRNCNSTNVALFRLKSSNNLVLATISHVFGYFNVFINTPPMTVTVSVEGLKKTDDQIIVTLPDNVLQFNFPDQGFSKNGTIRIV